MDTIQAAASAPTNTFELSRPFFDVELRPRWPNAEGFLRVVHRLRRPTPGQENEYKRLTVMRERVRASGETEDEGAELGRARCWLWDQIAAGVSGYPGLKGDPDAEGFYPVTREMAEKMRSTHKELAISNLFACEARAVIEDSALTLDGGEYAVRLALGEGGQPYAALRLRLREWTESERRNFEKHASTVTARTEGKSRVGSTVINQPAFSALFDATLIGVAAEPGGLIEQVTVNGQPFSPATKDDFCATLLGEWKTDVISELVPIWRGK